VCGRPCWPIRRAAAELLNATSTTTSGAHVRQFSGVRRTRMAVQRREAHTYGSSAASGAHAWRSSGPGVVLVAVGEHGVLACDPTVAGNHSGAAIASAHEPPVRVALPALHGWPLPARPRLPLRAQRTASAQARLSRTAGSADAAKLKAFRRPQHSGRRHAEDRLITFVRLTPSKWLMLASLRSSRRGLTRSTVVEAAGPGGKRWNPCPLMTCRDPAREVPIRGCSRPRM
jgi:hypothetical protein